MTDSTKKHKRSPGLQRVSWFASELRRRSLHGSLVMSPLNITQPLGISGLLDGYYKVMSNIPKMGHLPTPGLDELSMSLVRFVHSLLDADFCLGSLFQFPSISYPKLALLYHSWSPDSAVGVG